jgi:PAS domain S-box-containing protein
VWADIRAKKENYRWYRSPFAVEIPVRVFIELGFLTVFSWLVSFNPPPWNPDITWDHVTSSWLYTVAAKHVLTSYILILTAQMLLALTPVRRLFGLPDSPADRYITAIYSGAVLAAVLLWILDAVFDYLFFTPDKTFWEAAVLEVDGHNFFMRLLYFLAALVAASIIAALTRHRIFLHTRLRHLNRVLTAIRNVNQLITHERDKSVLLSESCRMLTETGGFKSSWIVLLRGDRPGEYFYSGFSHHFSSMAKSLEEGELPFCAWEAMQAKKIHIVESPARECPACPLAGKFAGISELVMPLEYNERVFGWLCVTVPRELVHDREEQDLFWEVGTDLGYALWALETEQEKDTVTREYQAVLNSTPNAVLALDLQEKITLFSPGAERLFECPGHEALGASISDFCPADLLAEQGEKLRIVREQGAQKNYETERLTRQGRRVPVEVSLGLIRDGQGNPAGYSAILRDITEHKKYEQELARLNADLKAKNSELEQVVYVASHDLRTPLVNIDGYSRELSTCLQELSQELENYFPAVMASETVKSTVREDIPEALHYIQTSAAKMDKLLSGLLRLSRTGRAALEIRTLDMNELVANVIDSTEFKIREAGAKVEVAELPQCVGDAVQVNQVFSNLIDNALKYLDPSRPGLIRVSGWRKNGSCVYCVQDNGRGIKTDHLKKIFEIFHRLDPGQGTGEGLGLTIVRRIMDRLGGTVRAESSVGEGSCFYLTLPAAHGTDTDNEESIPDSG